MTEAPNALDRLGAKRTLAGLGLVIAAVWWTLHVTESSVCAMVKTEALNWAAEAVANKAVKSADPGLCFGFDEDVVHGYGTISLNVAVQAPDWMASEMARSPRFKAEADVFSYRFERRGIAWQITGVSHGLRQ